MWQKDGAFLEQPFIVIWNVNDLISKEDWSTNGTKLPKTTSKQTMCAGNALLDATNIYCGPCITNRFIGMAKEEREQIQNDNVKELTLPCKMVLFLADQRLPYPESLKKHLIGGNYER